MGTVCLSATVLINIYESLNISQVEARKCLLLSICKGLLHRDDNNDLVSNARSLSTEAKVEGIKELMRMAKEYTATDEFKQEYKKWRHNKLNPQAKTKLGIPKLGKMLENAVDNKLDKGDNEKIYPSDATDMVKKRLTQYLQLSATVDFDAVVKDRRFVNPEYEKKSSDWKMCFRAGKEVNEAAREFAKEWLKEL